MGRVIDGSTKFHHKTNDPEDRRRWRGHRFGKLAARVTNPPAKANIEHSQKEGDCRIGMVAGVRADSRARGRDGRGHRDPTTGSVGPLRRRDEAVELLSRIRGFGPANAVSRVERGKSKTSGFAFLIGEILAHSQVNRSAK